MIKVDLKVCKCFFIVQIATIAKLFWKRLLVFLTDFDTVKSKNREKGSVFDLSLLI